MVRRTIKLTNDRLRCNKTIIWPKVEGDKKVGTAISAVKEAAKNKLLK